MRTFCAPKGFAVFLCLPGHLAVCARAQLCNLGSMDLCKFYGSWVYARMTWRVPSPWQWHKVYQWSCFLVNRTHQKRCQYKAGGVWVNKSEKFIRNFKLLLENVVFLQIWALSATALNMSVYVFLQMCLKHNVFFLGLLWFILKIIINRDYFPQSNILCWIKKYFF